MSCHILQRWEHKLFSMEVTRLRHTTSEALTRECLRSGGRGRPFIPINPDQVEFLISVGRSMEEIAQTLLISRRTLHRRCEEFQICKNRERYCQLSDSDLDDIMCHLISANAVGTSTRNGCAGSTTEIKGVAVAC